MLVTVTLEIYGATISVDGTGVGETLVVGVGVGEVDGQYDGLFILTVTTGLVPMLPAASYALAVKAWVCAPLHG